MITKRTTIVLFSSLLVTALAAPVGAAEICGNGVDDDSDGMADEGCYDLASGVCESPLSCHETGMVSPLVGSLRYQLPPDVAPKVPFGPGVGLRRFYSSQFWPGITAPPTYQDKGAKADGNNSVTPAWPTIHQTNDVALLIVETAGTQPATLSNAQGFVAVTGSPQGDNGDTSGTVVTVFWKRATSSSQASPTVADSGDHQVAQIITFRNVATTGDPWDVTAGSATAGTASSSFSIPGATTTQPNTLVVAILSTSLASSATGWTNADLTGVAEHSDVSTTSGNDGGIAVATGVKVTAGPYGATTGTTAASVRQARMSIALRPVDSAPVWKKPMGERWQHTYSTWLSKSGSAPSSTIVLHTNRGQDIRAPYASTAGGFDTYLPQTGFHAQYLRQRTTSPNEFQLRLLTGETLIYDSTGRLSEIWDTLATPNKVLVAYDGNGQVSTVTDASTQRRLLFAYTGSVLTTVAFQVKVSGTFTTYHTTSYGYSSGSLTTVTIGGQLAQTNVYTNGYLTQIQDGAANSIIAFAYNATPGKIARIDTRSGVLGYDYNSARASCSAKTVLYFNLGNTSSCDVDSDCGSGFLCGGKTSTGSTGKCFRGARCLTVSSPSEDVITTVTALGPPSESCEGACLEASQYVWNTGTGILDLGAIQDPSGNYTVSAFNSNGLPTTISSGDPDTNPSNGNGARVQWISYDSTFPGKVAETRRQSDLIAGTGCQPTSGEASCARNIFTYNSDGKLWKLEQTGATVNSSNSIAAFNYVTTNTYDSKGRLTQIDGPLFGSNDVTQLTYYTASGGFADDFVDEYKRKKDATNFVTQRAISYDFWGNPVALQDADTTWTCLVFNSARGYLEKRTEKMTNHTDCSADAANLVTSWARDSALRLTQITRPDGSCMFYEYDTKGRVLRTKRRDDCNAGSSGDKQEFVYDAEGLLTEIQTYDAASTLTAKQPFTYFDSRRLAKVVNPVDTSKWTGISYDSRGLVSQIDAAGNLGKTVFNRTGLPGADGRVTSVDKYKTSSTFDSWNLLFAWLGDQRAVTDGDSKQTESLRDDLGRIVQVVSPDMAAPRDQLYDEASRMTTIIDAYANAAQETHGFTFDNMGRPLDADFAIGSDFGTCLGSTNPPEIQRVYDAPPVTCPISGGCNRTEGRLAYEKVRLMCSTALGGDNSLDQETFYSYDDAGRVIREYIRDDASRVATHAFVWTKNGALQQVTLPSGAVLGWTHGSTGSNSDTDLVTEQWRTNASTLVTKSVGWNPYGPLKTYKHETTYGGVGTQTRITRNLAYRVTGIYHETTTGSATLHSVATTEDVKGRITARDYTPNGGGVQDSFFLYDDQDRLLCETTSSVSSCPSSGSNIKTSHTASPPFTNAGDWKQFARPSAGTTGLTHVINASGYGTSHRVTRIDQNDGTPVLGPTDFEYLATGERWKEYNTTSMSNADRIHTYDQRHNKRETAGWVRSGGTWYLYSAVSAFDARNRRVYKSFTANGTTSAWFFYYDPLDRLTEVKFVTPEGTNQTFQLFWLGDRLTAYWQTDSGGTTTKRYVATDETNRPIDMWNWPTSGDTARVWAVNPSAWGFDTNLVGPSVFQPILFAGQFQDSETAVYQNDGTTRHRPGLAHNGFRTYDPFTGSYLQVDPLASRSWSTYVYVDSNPVGQKDPSGLMIRKKCTSGHLSDEDYPGMIVVNGTQCWPEEDGSGDGGPGQGEDLPHGHHGSDGVPTGGHSVTQPAKGPWWEKYGEQRPAKRQWNSITCGELSQTVAAAGSLCVTAIADSLRHDCFCKVSGGDWTYEGLKTKDDCFLAEQGNASVTCNFGECRDYHIARDGYEQVCPGDCGVAYWYLCD